jgi:hypothetical protein
LSSFEWWSEGVQSTSESAEGGLSQPPSVKHKINPEVSPPNKQRGPRRARGASATSEVNDTTGESNTGRNVV